MDGKEIFTTDFSSVLISLTLLFLEGCLHRLLCFNHLLSHFFFNSSTGTLSIFIELFYYLLMLWVKFVKFGVVHRSLIGYRSFMVPFLPFGFCFQLGSFVFELFLIFLSFSSLNLYLLFQWVNLYLKILLFLLRFIIHFFNPLLSLLLSLLYCRLSILSF